LSPRSPTGAPHLDPSDHLWFCPPPHPKPPFAAFGKYNSFGKTIVINIHELLTLYPVSRTGDKVEFDTFDFVAGVYWV